MVTQLPCTAASFGGTQCRRSTSERRDQELLAAKTLGSFKPEHVTTWITALEDTVPAESHRRVIVGTVSAALSAAVGDGLLTK
ncbi:hypothetical protein [Streptomyces phaeochromogenes]|uniref:hypothetical protein n=1 Tax=Streptomyces phaeochromogenes TaxID=1923 RepID=UPI002E1245E8|nr:hypothetical protein OG437_29135 [Streptomyces phaeochromogenes]